MSDLSKIVLATGNPGKIVEIGKMLAPTSINVVAQSELNIAEAVEDQPTFVENALIKARHACHHSGLPAIADDSGLVVDAIGGEPGVISSRYSGPDSNDEKNIRKLLGKMGGVSDRSCKFRCVMVFLQHALDPSPIIAEGTLKGLIFHKRQGHFGFGYDPIFWLPEHDCTLAELNMKKKNQISHRGQALRGLVKQLTTLVHKNVN